MLRQNPDRNKEIIGIVLIPGAGLGSWIWKDVERLIDLPVLSIDLSKKNTLESMADQAVEQIDNFGNEKVILLCHSASGVIGTKIAHKIKDKLVGFVAISAAIPKNGGSFISCLPFPKNLIMSVLLRVIGTKPPESAITQGLCNDLSSEQTERVVQQFNPEPRAYYLERSNVSAPNTKTLYIMTTNDKELPLNLQKQMAKNLNANEVVSINSGYMPMLSKPKHLAEAINNFPKGI